MAIHPLSDVKTQKIGKSTNVWQYCVILEDASIGDNCNICFNVFIENNVVVGNNVTIKPGVQLWDGIEVEDDVFIGPNVTFTNDLVPRSKLQTAHYLETISQKGGAVLLKKGCSIGANSTVITGVTIGEYSFIGAGSIVTKSIPPHTVWYGNPARHKGYITKDGVFLNMDLKSKDGMQFVFKNNFLESA